MCGKLLPECPHEMVPSPVTRVVGKTLVAQALREMAELLDAQAAISWREAESRVCLKPAEAA
jgi:hypothetical protein